MARQARTTENLKERMADALLDLLVQKPYADISVSEITDRADVGRATYYRHFASKDEVLLFKFKTIFERDLDVEDIPFDHHSPQAMERYFTAYLSNLAASRDVLERVYAAGLDSLLFIYMYRTVVTEAADREIVDRYRVALHSASTFAIVDQWITSGFAQSPGELIDMLMNQLRPPGAPKGGGHCSEGRARDEDGQG